MKFSQVEPFIQSEDIEAINSYLHSGGWITEHKVTQNLENTIKDYIGRKYAVAVPNGTIAIYLSLVAAGIGEGNKVAIPNLTMVATINAIIWAGAEPVLFDVDSSYCMSYDEIKKTKNIDALIYVPLNGRTSNGRKINDWCKKNNIIMIEDSAHALGSNYEKQKCGSLGDISIFSFTPHKIITMGQGGMILTDNKDIYEYLIEIKTFNREKDKTDWHAGFGLNFKITDLQASLGLSQYSKLEEFIENKKKNYINYLENINHPKVKVLEFMEYEVPWFFDVYIHDLNFKKKLVNELSRNGIETRDFYPALSLQKYLKTYKHDNLKKSEADFEHLLWLPSSNKLNKKDILYISSVINKIN